VAIHRQLLVVTNGGLAQCGLEYDDATGDPSLVTLAGIWAENKSPVDLRIEIESPTGEIRTILVPPGAQLERKLNVMDMNVRFERKSDPAASRDERTGLPVPGIVYEFPEGFTFRTAG
jgi:hypothetical protein